MTFGIDKLKHLIVCILLTILFCVALFLINFERHYVGGIITLILAFGLEYYQMKTKKLDKFNWGDMFVNILGVFAGWFITYTIILY